MNVPSTRKSLLGRLRDPSDREAWGQFVESYGPAIVHWSQNWLKNLEEARDLCQDILFKLVSLLREFEYDETKAGFAAWLRACVDNACLSALRKRKRDAQLLQSWNESTQAEKRIRLHQELEKAYRREIHEFASSRVRERLKNHPASNPLTWRAYELTTPMELGGSALTIDEAARLLGVDVDFIYKARSNVIKMLQEEVTRLTDGDSEN
jgi:RNA polymerase sigma factor (sigma-70 family)